MGAAGAPLKPLRDDSALRALSSLRGLRRAPEVAPLCRETSVSWTANVETVGMNGLINVTGLSSACIVLWYNNIISIAVAGLIIVKVGC